MKRIICIGNRYIPGDSAGSAVYEHLCRSSIPHDIEVIDGGLGGLNLLGFLEGVETVVFVDNVFYPERFDELILLERSEIIKNAAAGYDHSAGPGYLISVLPYVYQGNIPHIFLVGINAEQTQALIKKAAALALKTAIHKIALGTR